MTSAILYNVFTSCFIFVCILLSFILKYLLLNLGKQLALIVLDP